MKSNISKNIRKPNSNLTYNIQYGSQVAAPRRSAHACRLDTHIAELHLSLNITVFWQEIIDEEQHIKEYKKT